MSVNVLEKFQASLSKQDLGISLDERPRPSYKELSPSPGGTNLYSSQCPNKSCSICLLREQDSCSQERYTVLPSS